MRDDCWWKTAQRAGLVRNLLPLIGIILIIVLPNGSRGLGVPARGLVRPDPPAPKPAPTSLDELQKLADLKDRGVLTQQEFDDKKREIPVARVSTNDEHVAHRQI